MRFALFPALLSASVLLVAGCASPSTDDDGSLADGADQEVRGATKIVEAKMYTQPNAQPNAFCDVHTALTVFKTSQGKLLLELENRLAGACEIFVQPDKRTYTVTESESCGSKVYKATRGGDSVELQDNRTRSCRDVRPAILELKEKRGGRDLALFGAPSAATGGTGGMGTAILDEKLYDEPHAQVSPSCDRHTHLALTREGDKLKARLVHKLSATSTCEIHVPPNEKVFTVTQSEDCGSKVYSGTAGGDRIVIQDHATRLCENVIPARVEVELTTGGQSQHLFTAE